MISSKPKEASFKEFLKDQIEDKVTDMKNPECKMCNACCSMGTMLLTQEYEQLKKFLKTKEGKKIFHESIHKIKRYRKQGTIYWLCPFSTSNRRCAIYSIRPKACRDFHCSPGLNKLVKKELSDINHHTIFDLFKHIK